MAAKKLTTTLYSLRDLANWAPRERGEAIAEVEIVGEVYFSPKTPIKCGQFFLVAALPNGEHRAAWVLQESGQSYLVDMTGQQDCPETPLKKGSYTWDPRPYCTQISVAKRVCGVE